MAAPDSAIRSAFVTRLLTFPNLPTVAWENVHFTPTIGSPYLKPFLLPGEPIQAEIGENGRNRHVGVFQISLFYPAGNGIGLADTMRDGIIEHFKRGTILTNGVINVEIIKAYGGPILEEPGWMHRPITIRYRVLVSN